MTTRLVARRHDWVDPAVVFEAILSGEEHAFWLDAGPGATTGFSWLGTGAPGVGPRDVALVPDVRPAAVVPGPFQGGWVGWSGFDDAAAAAGAPGRADPADGPQELWLRIEWFVVFDHAAHEVWIAAPADRGEALASAVDGAATAAPRTATPRGSAAHRPPPVASARQTPEEYRALIARCRDAIRAGDAYQLCLTTRFTVAASAPFDPTSTYLTLREALPAHHGGIIRSGATALLSASPERFLDVADGLVRTRPIKGTRPRGRDAEEDAALRRELVDSVKERAENVMIVDLMRNDLQRVCRPGTVRAERLLEVESYAAVHQLVSTVAGRLRPDATLGQLLTPLFRREHDRSAEAVSDDDPFGAGRASPRHLCRMLRLGRHRRPRGPGDDDQVHRASSGQSVRRRRRRHHLALRSRRRGRRGGTQSPRPPRGAG